ncbi:MAG: hypothetical protein JXR96_15075 [Deltaproteobacteria bacterium]|nr:hypothetical protein [Deltaproteobacteria bacterium]
MHKLSDGEVSYCIFTHSRAAGEPCALDSINELWGSCRDGLTCVGMGSEVACPGGIPDCEGVFPGSWNPWCTLDTGLCGASFCAAPCGAGDTCGASFEPVDVEGECFCAPSL